MTIISTALTTSGREATVVSCALCLEDIQYATQLLGDGSRMYQFRTMTEALDYAQAAVSWIRNNTKHEAELDGPYECKSNQWKISCRDGYRTVYLPTIEVRFLCGRQVEGIIVADDFGMPLGVLVVDCDRRTRKIGKIIRF